MAQLDAYSMNYTDLDSMITSNNHVYVVGTEIIIFLLIIIAFCNIVNLIGKLIRFMFPPKNINGGI